MQHDLVNAPVSRAIGYRQTIEFLGRENFQPGDIKAFEEYLTRFKAATRQYAKQQMQWWRRSEDIMFVPVDVKRGMSTEEVNDSLAAGEARRGEREGGVNELLKLWSNSSNQRQSTSIQRSASSTS